VGGVVPDDALRSGPPPLGRRLFGIGLGLLGVVGFIVLSANPNFAEAVVGSGPVPVLRQGLSLLTGLVPFSLAEFVVLAVVVRVGVGIRKGVRSIRSGVVRVPAALGYGALRAAQDAGVLLFLFYLLWGFQYARPGLEAHMGIEASGEVSVDELHELALRSVEATNFLYRELHGVPDAGEPTARGNASEMVPPLESGWRHVIDILGLPEQVGGRRGSPKPFLASPVVKRFGISGMHFPFTGEALFLRDLPGVLHPVNLAHEMAHQRGFARESDANVLGFLVAAYSDDVIARYAAQHFLQRQLITALQRLSPEAARGVQRERDPGVVRDTEHLREYWQPARGMVGTAATRVNDAMLRSHGIPEGVGSYQGSVWVLIALARERGDDILRP
jgi:hypothetical protein